MERQGNNSLGFSLLLIFQIAPPPGENLSSPHFHRSDILGFSELLGEYMVNYLAMKMGRRENFSWRALYQNGEKGNNSLGFSLLLIFQIAPPQEKISLLLILLEMTY